jgi:hypothetical protein
MAPASRARRPEAGAVARAVRFLTATQSADGAWRSASYGAFRAGEALTPLVLWALPPEAPAFAAGLRWLEKLTAAQAAQRESWRGLAYPLFTAAYAAQVFAAARDRRRAEFWANLVEALRTSPTLGWPAESTACGAWSDASTPPVLTDPRAPVPDMLAPNLSATVLALQALSAVGRRDSCRGALAFVRSCQNFREPAGGDFDDGGFFFAPGDPVRNKAGVAGHDGAGRERYRSYGSATCDGLLALHACGAAAEDPRMRAARAWVFGGESGGRLRALSETPAALRFYAAQGWAAVLAVEGASERAALTTEMIDSQGSDGSWRNEAADSFEDERLVATAFALRALSSREAGGASN